MSQEIPITEEEWRDYLGVPSTILKWSIDRLRREQIIQVLESAQVVTQINETRSWLLRLWECCQGSGVKSEHEGDLLFHESLTFMAQSNPEGRIGEAFLPAALANAKESVKPA